MIRQNTATAMTGEAITSGMLYFVTPISLRMSYCQYCPSPNETANRTPALAKNAVHAQRPERRGDAGNNSLKKTAARQQRRGEGQARENQGAPAAGQRGVQQFAAFPTLWMAGH